MYIDAHTHHKSQGSNHYSLIVGVHALGIHPWELTGPFDRESFDKKWEILIADKKFFAIGECGLDRMREGIASIEDQSYVLLVHLRHAEEKKMPVILHSVRAISDYLGIFKKVKFTQNRLFHDFCGNAQEVQELLKYPSFFSFGHRLIKNEKAIKLVPIDRLLLETDDQTEVGIEEIYQKAAVILEISLEKLQKQIQNNFLSFFNQLDDIGSTDFINNFRSTASFR
jgi:TatD DNase family protein